MLRFALSQQWHLRILTCKHLCFTVIIRWKSTRSTAYTTSEISMLNIRMGSLYFSTGLFPLPSIPVATDCTQQFLKYAHLGLKYVCERVYEYVSSESSRCVFVYACKKKERKKRRVTPRLGCPSREVWRSLRHLSILTPFQESQV